MNRTLRRTLVLAALAAASLWFARAGASPTVTFEIDPPNPVAGQTVVLRDTSPAAATSWLWDFGDGSSATTAAPSHVWNAAGPYTVRLTSQDTSTEADVTVSASTTLRLLGVHPFEISIAAKDPNTGADSPAQAVAVTDRFGWFSFPGITHDPGNPEVTFKVLEAPTFGHYWVFWSAMTSLHYTMTVRDVTTGQVQVYEKTDDSPCGSWDTETFPFMPTPTPGSPTPTPVPGQPTRTRTPTATKTPTGTPTVTPTITPTPAPSGPATISLRAQAYPWQWNWCPDSDQGASGKPQCQQRSYCGYDIEETSTGVGPPGMQITCHGCVIHLHQGCTYNLYVYSGDDPSGDEVYPHALGEINALGIPSITIPVGYIPSSPLSFEVPAGASDQGFNCTNQSCANGGS
ncbi:MAG TPA: PKD domain-containing protein, partial [Thermoanaerobaculia bacterium]|nr:PKD domain-containing protein [Thermoanaerobaculia bacterium]